MTTPLGDELCVLHLQGTCSSTDGRAVVWTALGIGLCGRHEESFQRRSVAGVRA